MPQMLLAAYSIYQGVQAGNQARDDRRSRDAAVSRSEATAREDRDYYRKKFGPVSQMLVDYAMGNKPSPYLAKAKGRVEAGYQKGMVQLAEISGRSGLGSSGVGVGQKLGFGMEKVKTLAGLDLEDQAQRYGVAQSLSSKEDLALQGSSGMQRAYGMQAGYSADDASRNEAYQNQAFADAGEALGSYVENVSSGANWYGVKPKPATDKQTAKIEAGGNKPGWSMSGGVGAGGYTGNLV